ncbi:site-specific DNA-methyltransferase [Luteimonas sp. Y-2-2-4F]|nr:site-specific DNA-methyltransferase [Luteimonas sp. Y-2-2-4F]MCD9033325.1 site-specific DNA-methyltransferase [Luteimonas sp. Y-2-2-4F]
MTARKAVKKVVNKATKKTATKKVVTKKVPVKVAKKAAVELTTGAEPVADVLARVRGAQQAVTIGKAGGRPMLSWVGKRAPASVQAFPAQLVETYGEQAPDGALWKQWPDGLRRGGLLYHGDNKEVLAHLLANGFRGQVKLIYIDPPFDSGADYVRKVELRGPKGKVKLEGEGYTLGEQIQYTDIWANDNYLQFMYERLLLLKELLADGGAIFLHCDSSKGAFLRILMDEVFGSDGFVNEVVWSYRRWPSNVPAFQSMHDTIFYYVIERRNRRTFHKQYEDASDSYLKRFGGKTQILDAESGTRKITSDEATKGMPLRDVWDLSILAGVKSERVGYPTQKPEELVARIVEVCSNPGDLVLDCFIGSGTAAAVAQKLGRRWIGCDINKGAIQTTAKRLQLVMAEQAGKSGKPAQGKLLGDEDAASPAQLGFTHWRVNDYDLAIQHNEAVNLACEYLGVERLRNDAYFDGLLGKRLVKIIPFGHPLSPMDLEAIKNELDARPDEDRAITVVCLGKELASDTWLTEWNRLRKKKTDPHHIEVIELRNDPKYGGFIQHQQAQARVAVKRKGAKLHIEIKDFVSPGILQRLAQQSGVVQARVADWRAMVDSVMIDTAYDGAVFHVVHADVPARKTDFVAGEYTLDAPDGETAVVVKITDMLGEEVLVTQAA